MRKLVVRGVVLPCSADGFRGGGPDVRGREIHRRPLVLAVPMSQETGIRRDAVSSNNCLVEHPRFWSRCSFARHSWAKVQVSSAGFSETL